MARGHRYTIIMLTAALLLGACDDERPPAVIFDAAAPDVMADVGVDQTPKCPAGTKRCAGKCVDLAKDDDNCGACGTACKTGEVCSAGKCALWCQKGLTECSGKCVDLLSDLANCGKCATACKAGEVCSAGKCALSCQKGLTDCAGKCVDTGKDSKNCGACATACKVGEVCTAGTCALSCQKGLTVCAGKCVDLQADNKNCYDPDALGRLMFRPAPCSGNTLHPKRPLDNTRLLAALRSPRRPGASACILARMRCEQFNVLPRTTHQNLSFEVRAPSCKMH